MFHNIQIDLLILKTYYWQFSLTTKKSLHIIFKVCIAFIWYWHKGSDVSFLRIWFNIA